MLAVLIKEVRFPPLHGKLGHTFPAIKDPSGVSIRIGKVWITLQEDEYILLEE